MQIAEVGGVRLLPSPGLKGQCPLCGRSALAKCGDINRWHWSHAGRRHCDPWQENEGPWHRTWKSLFPLEMQEIVHYDEATTEKHIADIKRSDGWVIELQNSPMSIQEMESRESFYGDKMIWIVNAEKFRHHISIFEALPDPKADFVADLIIVQPHPQWKNNRVIIKGDGGSLMFWRRSDVRPDGTPTHELHSGGSLGDLVTRNYIGHHLCLWQHSREVWLRAKRTVVLDFGSEVMWAIRRYGVEQFFCLQKTLKSALIESLLARQSPTIGSVTRR